MENVVIDRAQFKKMNFIMNAIDCGWSVTKNEDAYIFKKKHEGKQEVFMADYLEKFIVANMDLDKYSLGKK
jgi:hypothetical protein